MFGAEPLGDEAREPAPRLDVVGQGRTRDEPLQPALFGGKFVGEGDQSGRILLQRRLVVVQLPDGSRDDHSQPTRSGVVEHPGPEVGDPRLEVVRKPVLVSEDVAESRGEEGSLVRQPLAVSQRRLDRRRERQPVGEPEVLGQVPDDVGPCFGGNPVEDLQHEAPGGRGRGAMLSRGRSPVLRLPSAGEADDVPERVLSDARRGRLAQEREVLDHRAVDAAPRARPPAPRRGPCCRRG